MAILEILQYPDPRLRTVATLVTEVNDTIWQIVSDLLATMYHAQGVGLAATQVDIHQRIVVMDTSDARDAPIVMINPRYEVLGDAQSTLKEGCLSVPGFYEALGRSETIQLTALDDQGREFTKTLDGLASVCVQHEIDHLDGKLLVDYVSRLKRDRIRKKLEKEQRLHQQAAQTAEPSSMQQ